MKIKKLLISLILLMVMLFSSACFSDMDPNGQGFNAIGNIQGFKANYRPETYNYYDFYYDFSYTTLDRLFKTFYYNPANQDLISVYKQINNVAEVDINSAEWKNFSAYFYSDIQYTTFVLKDENGNLIKPDGTASDVAYYMGNSSAWKWNLNLGNDYHYFLKNTATSDLNNISNFYTEINNTENYKTAVDKHAKALQVAVLEIILGKTPTIFTTANVDTAVSVLGSASLENNQVNATGLMGELVKKGTYVGINDQALSQIKNYIVENVIGNQKFYETDQDNNFERQDYETVIDTIWQDRDSFMFKSIFDQTTMEGCVFDEYPATYIKDYKSNSFFINSNDDIAFEHIESAEYQSILVMPSETQYLEEIWLFLVSDRQFKVNFYTRYYNHETNTLYVSDVKSVYTTVESEFKAESTPIAEATFYNDIIKISEFDNNLGNDILKADNIVPMNLERSQYYSPQESLNNFGTISVFNPEAFAENDFSFAEIVFDVEKNSNLDQDYNFKIGMFYYGVPSSEAIREFERK